MWQQPWSAFLPAGTSPAVDGFLGRFSRIAAGLLGLAFLTAVAVRSPESSLTGWNLVAGCMFFALIAGAPTGKRGTLAPLDVLLGAICLAASAYRLDAVPRLLEPDAVAGPTDIAVAAMLVFVAIELGRRCAGWPAAILFVCWIAALAFRTKLPERFAGPELDLAGFAVNQFLDADVTWSALLQVVFDQFLPIAVFAGVFMRSGFSSVIAGAMPRFGADAFPVAMLISSPFSLDQDSSGARLRWATSVRALSSLVPPVLGLGPLLLAKVLGWSFGDAVLRLLPAGLLLLAVLAVGIRARRRPAQVPVSGSLLTAAFVISPLFLVLVLFLRDSIGPAFYGAALIAAIASITRRPSVRSVLEIISGVVWAGRASLAATGLVIFLGLVLSVESLTGFFATFSINLAGLPERAVSVVWPVAAALLGAFLAPAAAAYAVALLALLGWPDAAPQFALAGLFWVAVGAIVAYEPVSALRPGGLVARLYQAAPVALVGLVLTRTVVAVLSEQVLGFESYILDSFAILLISTALAGRPSRRLDVQLMLFLSGAFLLLPAAEWLVAGIIGATIALLLTIRQYRRPPGALQEALDGIQTKIRAFIASRRRGGPIVLDPAPDGDSITSGDM